MFVTTSNNFIFEWLCWIHNYCNGNVCQWNNEVINFVVICIKIIYHKNCTSNENSGPLELQKKKEKKYYSFWFQINILAYIEISPFKSSTVNIMNDYYKLNSLKHEIKIIVKSSWTCIYHPTTY